MSLPASSIKIVTCSWACPAEIIPMQMRPSWISSIVHSSVLHEYHQLFPDASFMNIVSGWVLHEYRQLFVNRQRPASCRVQHPAPRMRPASYMEVSLGTSVFFILHQLLAAWMDASCIDTAARPWLELPWFIVLHVEVIYFSMQPKVRKLLGVLYREYYQYTEPQTLLQLYISLVRPKKYSMIIGMK